MWTEITRRKYDRAVQRYASSLSDAEWALIEPFMPVRKLLGRPRETDLRAVLRAFVSPPRWDALSPSCGSLERHRLFALVLNSMRPIITDGASVLNFAPEKCTKTLLQRVGIKYTSADLHETVVDLVSQVGQVHEMF